MMFWWWLEHGITAFAIVANGGMIAWHVRALRRIRVLDRLLQQLCLDACVRQNTPAWTAWAATMGDIGVEVTTNRKRWDA